MSLIVQQRLVHGKWLRTDVFAADTEASNDNVYSELQQPFAPIAGAVGGVGGEDVCSEPFAMY